MLSDWPYLAAALGLLVALAAGAYLWWRRRRPDPMTALKSVAIASIHDVVLPDGMGGDIHVEYLVLTARGMLVIDVKRFEGIIFASDRMDDWTVIAKDGRYAFPNPQGTLYDRVAAVKRLVRDVPVTGFVLFGAGADFSKGRPKDVLLPGELSEGYKKPERSEVERLTEAFSPHWERVREAARPAREAAVSQ
jgi:hypothetical protein